MRYSRLGEETCRFPRTRTSGYGLYRMCEDTPALNEKNGFRSATIVNMGAVALRLNRTLNFDPVKLEFIDDEAANRLLDQPMRAPWNI